MKTEIVDKNEAIYQLQYYNKVYLAHKKVNKLFLILFSTIIFV